MMPNISKPEIIGKYFLKHKCEKFQKSAKMLIKCRKFSWARWYRTHDTKQGDTVVKWDFHISQVSHPKNVIKYSYQKAMGHDDIITIWLCSKNTFKWYPYHKFPKKATADHAIRCLCHRCHVKVLTNCCKMMPISYISKKGNGTWLHLLCCVVTLWGSHNIA